MAVLKAKERSAGAERSQEGSPLGIIGLKSGCSRGRSAQRLWGRVHVCADSLAKSRSCGCRTEVPVSLLAVRGGHCPLPSLPHFWTFLAPSTPHLQWCVRAFSGFEPLTFSSEIGWRKFSASRGSLVRSGPLKTSPFCQTTRSPPLVVFTGCSHTQEAIPRGEGQPIRLGGQTASWRRQPGRPCALKRGRWALQAEGGPLCSLQPPSIESLPRASRLPEPRAQVQDGEAENQGSEWRGRGARPALDSRGPCRAPTSRTDQQGPSLHLERPPAPLQRARRARSPWPPLRRILSILSPCRTCLVRLRVLNWPLSQMAVRCYQVNAAIFTGGPRKKEAVLNFDEKLCSLPRQQVPSEEAREPGATERPCCRSSSPVAPLPPFLPWDRVTLQGVFSFPEPSPLHPVPSLSLAAQPTTLATSKASSSSVPLPTVCLPAPPCPGPLPACRLPPPRPRVQAGRAYSFLSGEEQTLCRPLL